MIDPNQITDLPWGMNEVMMDDVIHNMNQAGVRSRKCYCFRGADNRLYLGVALDRIGDNIYMRRIKYWPEPKREEKGVWWGTRHVDGVVGNGVLPQVPILIDEGRMKVVRAEGGGGGLILGMGTQVYEPLTVFPFSSTDDLNLVYMPRSDQVDSIIKRLPEACRRPYLELCSAAGLVNVAAGLNGPVQMGAVAVDSSDGGGGGGVNLQAIAAGEVAAAQTFSDDGGEVGGEGGGEGGEGGEGEGGEGEEGADRLGGLELPPPEPERKGISKFTDLNIWKSVVRPNLVDVCIIGWYVPVGGISVWNRDGICKMYRDRNQEWRRICAKLPITIGGAEREWLNKKYLGEFDSEADNLDEALLAFQLCRLADSLRQDVNYLQTQSVERDDRMIVNPVSYSVLEEFRSMGCSPIRALIDGMGNGIECDVYDKLSHTHYTQYSNSIEIKPSRVVRKGNEGQPVDLMDAIKMSFFVDDLELPVKKKVGKKGKVEQKGGAKKKKGKGRKGKKEGEGEGEGGGDGVILISGGGEKTEDVETRLVPVEREMTACHKPLLIEVNRNTTIVNVNGVVWEGGMNRIPVKGPETITLAGCEYCLQSIVYRISELIYGVVVKLGDGLWYQYDCDGWCVLEEGLKGCNKAVLRGAIAFLYTPVGMAEGGEGGGNGGVDAIGFDKMGGEPNVDVEKPGRKLMEPVPAGGMSVEIKKGGQNLVVDLRGLLN